MIVVFSFLVLLLIIIHISTKLLKPYTEKEASPATSRSPSKVTKVTKVTGKVKPSDDEKKLTAVISAAIAAHRARMVRHRSP